MGEFASFYKTEFSDAELGRLWERFVDSDRDQHIFYNLPPQDGKDFARYCRQDGIHMWVVLFRDEIAGIFWMTNHEGKTAYCHFGQLPTHSRRTDGRIPVQVGFGRYCLAQALWAHDGKDYLLDRLLGLTPAPNTKALHLLERVGTRVLGTLPGGCYFAADDKNVDGVATYYDRTIIPREWGLL